MWKKRKLLFHECMVLKPQEAEEIWRVTKSTRKLLQMHNQEHPVGLYHHRLVRQLLRPQP